jgi:hypothetical protein
MGNLSPIPSGLLPTTTSHPCSLLLTLLTSTAAHRPRRPPPPPPLDVARRAATSSCATADGPHRPALPPSGGPIPPRISAELGGELTGSAGSGGGTPPPTAPIGESGTDDLHRGRSSTGGLDHGGFTPTAAEQAPAAASPPRRRTRRAHGGLDSPPPLPPAAPPPPSPLSWRTELEGGREGGREGGGGRCSPERDAVWGELGRRRQDPSLHRSPRLTAGSWEREGGRAAGSRLRGSHRISSDVGRQLPEVDAKGDSHGVVRLTTIFLSLLHSKLDFADEDGVCCWR